VLDDRIRLRSFLLFGLLMARSRPFASGEEPDRSEA